MTHTSVDARMRASTINCSGAVNAVVPMVCGTSVEVRPAFSIPALPKSSTLSTGSLADPVTKRFSGFRSAWITHI